MVAPSEGEHYKKRKRIVKVDPKNLNAPQQLKRLDPGYKQDQ